MKRSKPRRGAIAVSFAAALLVVGTMVFWVFQSTSVSARNALALQHADTAFFAAESGMEFAFREVRTNADLDGDGVIGSISNDGNSANDPGMNQGTFMVARIGNTLTSTGTWQGRTRVIEAQIE